MDALKVGIVGLGTVGSSTAKILQENKKSLSERTGCSIEIAGVSARCRKSKRSYNTDQFPWFDDPFDLIDHVDVLIELVGGAEGVAYDLVSQALDKGVHVVTANKALIATHGYELAQIAEEKGVSLMFEASVAGGVPVIEAARQNFAANTMRGFHGILNGTCNYILTKMSSDGLDFETALKNAQDRGYAEADPTFDVSGVDTGHKVAILAAIVFGARPDFNAVHMTGIEALTQTDIRLADELGYKIKLLGSAYNHDGRILQIVEPCLVRKGRPLASIEKAYNAVFFDCNYAGTPLMSGLGAGGDATASAVVGDVVAIARGLQMPTFGKPAQDLQRPPQLDPREIQSRFYIRLSVLDKVGVMADVAAILRDTDISIETMIQHGRDPKDDVEVVVISHETLRDNIDEALYLIERLDVVSGKPCVIRIEDKL